MGTTADKLNKLVENKNAIKQALINKRGKDVGDNMSTYAQEITNIEPLLDTITITKNGTYDVKNYKNSKVLVENDTDKVLKGLIEGTSTSFEIPASVTKIGDYFLYGKNVDFSFVDKDAITSVGNYTFYNISTSGFKYNLTLDLPNCTSIGNNAFNKYFFSTINLPNCTSIGNYAFNGDSIGQQDVKNNLTLDLPNCTSIGEWSFRQIVGYFNNDYWLTVNLPKCTSIGKNSFRGNNITSIYAPLIKDIPEGILYNQSVKPLQQTKFYISSFFPSATSIGKEAFRSQGFKEVYIDINCNSIDNAAFYLCNKLEKLVLNNGLQTIGNSLFETTIIASIEIPASVTKIGNYFHTSKNKTTYKFLSTTPCTISTSTFSKNYLDKIYVPSGTSSTYKNATNWSTFADYIYEANNVVLNIPSTLVNNENITYSLDTGKTYNQFNLTTMVLQDVSILKIKSTDASQTILIGTTAGGSDVGTISNSELTFSFTTDTTVYLTIQ